MIPPPIHDGILDGLILYRPYTHTANTGFGIMNTSALQCSEHTISQQSPTKSRCSNLSAPPSVMTPEPTGRKYYTYIHTYICIYVSMHICMYVYVHMYPI